MRRARQNQQGPHAAVMSRGGFVTHPAIAAAFVTFPGRKPRILLQGRRENRLGGFDLRRKPA